MCPRKQRVAFALRLPRLADFYKAVNGTSADFLSKNAEYERQIKHKTFREVLRLGTGDISSCSSS